MHNQIKYFIQVRKKTTAEQNKIARLIKPIAGEYSRSIPEIPDGLVREADVLDWIFCFDNRTITDFVRARHPEIKLGDVGGYYRHRHKTGKNGLGVSLKAILYDSFGVTLYARITGPDESFF